MMSEIKIKHKYTSGMDKTYEGFSKLLVEMAYEKNYDRRAAKSRGDTDMDVDALAAEKEERQQQQHAARQAELEADDYGENVGYTDAEWVEYEKGPQDELNWLGARGGKQGKGKGKKGKGKDKDRNAKGKGYGGGQWQGKGKGSSTGCTWCGSEEHWRADCDKLKKHKTDMDADRKRQGLPAFVPRPRAVNSLDPEERHKTMVRFMRSLAPCVTVAMTTGIATFSRLHPEKIYVLVLARLGRRRELWVF